MSLFNSDPMQVSNNHLITYKGYPAQIEVDFEDNVFFGSVLGINDVLTFEENTLEKAIAEFHFIVDDYLSWCKEYGKAPEKPFDKNHN